jgi:glycosyltransferase involved in cell wall biosynthesis
MRFSVITPCRNAEGLVDATVRSVTSQHLAPGDTLQYLLVDGASCDRTVERALAAAAGSAVNPGAVDVDVVSEPDTGMYDALAKGLARAGGDVVSYLNAGDYYLPYALATVGAAVQECGLAWTSGLKGLVNGHGMLLGAQLPAPYRRRLLDSGFYGMRGRLGFIEQEVSFWSGELNATLDLGELRTYRLAGDFYLWHCFARRTDLVYLDAVLGGHRRHAGQLSEDVAGYRAEMARLTRPPTARDWAAATADTLGLYAPARVRRRIMGAGLATWRGHGKPNPAGVTFALAG